MAAFAARLLRRPDSTGINAGRGREARLAAALACAAESDAAAARLEWVERAVAALPEDDPESLPAKVAELKAALGCA